MEFTLIRCIMACIGVLIGIMIFGMANGTWLVPHTGDWH